MPARLFLPLLILLFFIPAPVFSQAMDSASYAAYADSLVQKQNRDARDRLTLRKEHEIQKLESEMKKRRTVTFTTLLLFVLGGLAFLAGGIILIIRLSRK